MANRDRQPVTQKSSPGSARYSDATRNSVVGKTTRVEVITQEKEVDAKSDAMPEMDFGPIG